MLMDARGIIRRAEEELRSEYLVELNEATVAQLHRALSNAVMYAMSDDWRRSRRAHEQTRRAYYLSAEYLVGQTPFPPYGLPLRYPLVEADSSFSRAAFPMTAACWALA